VECPQWIPVLVQGSAGLASPPTRIGPYCEQGHPWEAKLGEREREDEFLLMSDIAFHVSALFNWKKVRHYSISWKRETVEVIRSVNVSDCFRGVFLSLEGISFLRRLSVNQPNVAQASLVVTSHSIY
jgi:hypothetical protein